MNYVNVKEGDIPGTVIRDGGLYQELGGRYFRVIGLQPTQHHGLGPILDVPQMSDYQWQKRCLESRLAHPEHYAKFEDVDAHVARLRKWLAEHEGAEMEDVKAD